MKDKQNRQRSELLSRTVLGLGVGVLLALPQGAIAQTAGGADEAVWGSSSGGSLNSDGGASTLMDILQRSQTGPTQSRADFLEKQDENLNSAAAAFRARQLEVLKTTQPVQGEIEPEGNPQSQDLQSQDWQGAPRRALW